MVGRKRKSTRFHGFEKSKETEDVAKPKPILKKEMQKMISDLKEKNEEIENEKLDLEIELLEKKKEIENKENELNKLKDENQQLKEDLMKLKNETNLNRKSFQIEVTIYIFFITRKNLATFLFLQDMDSDSKGNESSNSDETDDHPPPKKRQRMVSQVIFKKIIQYLT